jgi:hypothetical protein
MKEKKRSRGTTNPEREGYSEFTYVDTQTTCVTNCSTIIVGTQRVPKQRHQKLCPYQISTVCKLPWPLCLPVMQDKTVHHLPQDLKTITTPSEQTGLQICRPSVKQKPLLPTNRKCNGYNGKVLHRQMHGQSRNIPHTQTHARTHVKTSKSVCS